MLHGILLLAALSTFFSVGRLKIFYFLIPLWSLLLLWLDDDARVCAVAVKAADIDRVSVITATDETGEDAFRGCFEVAVVDACINDYVGPWLQLPTPLLKTSLTFQRNL
ncbi:hypothetical protein PoB_007361400 [Plakobranchus ocellatus]|uniref:Secreted protein n=1 Tax=Plakobranchus ocellatus TaxID=259542 RepID=A0AAV4DS88_9GAST|nr:hypothetical protein PoB_007361400 [Plakobranchus ocellatus]